MQGVNFVTPKDIPYCVSTEPWDLQGLEQMQIDPDISAVIVAFQPDFNYRHLCYASACLRENPGCLLLSSNPDASDKVAGGRRMPGTGCIVAAVETASGVSAVRISDSVNKTLLGYSH